MPTTDSPHAAVAPAAVPSSGPLLAAGETTRTVPLSGLSLVVRSHEIRGAAGSGGGSGPGGGAPADVEPALFVHGLGGSSQNWSPLMDKLADQVACEALDLPGFGYSPPPDDGDFSVAGQARAVVRL